MPHKFSSLFHALPFSFPHFTRRRHPVRGRYRRSLLLACAMASCGAQATATQFPLTLQNCGSTLTFQRAPTKVVTIGQTGSEMLYALGLGDKLVGTSLWFNNVLPQYQAQNAKVERLADNAPGFETVISKRPQLVVSQFEMMVGPQGVVGSRQQFDELNIPTYVMPADCEGKNNLIGADGTRQETFRIESLYKSISQLAAIFDVQPRGQQLNDELQARLAKARAMTQRQDLSHTSALFWFSSSDLKSDPFVAGRKGVPDFMLNTLGVHNIVESDEEWPAVGWETIAKANPTFIIIARMDRRRFPADDHQKKLAFLQHDPVTRNMAAVKNNRIIILDAEAMHASLRMFGGLETIASAIAKNADLPK
ncbi:MULTISPECIES: ABC transporter substrate-binding protein [Pectobacteriaceae]|nr:MULTISPECIES: ABC transporter substrate-binding protein [Pectobacteriaceae]MEE3644457.1 ABC transporter substrate-binding protein [Brenneria sp. L3_3C_1]MEE3652019.1 ABC transporter substrate-binding protein [Brenneria sp. HEZEL_4_2_4]MEE3663635.1 ABC transporter substrate-binding protein [Brenneria sp. g21c3]MBJ7223215.1 ABC transporter substrate-binding protein [Brenneria sp. L3-3C-1]MDX5628573.1 ABC transporter substrate-binding protein [Brenneria sp. L3-3Z]